jgi:hypothetical protein
VAEIAIAAALALEPSVRYVVLPELFTCSCSVLESVYLYAEDAEFGESARFFTALARELGIYIAYGFPEGIAGSPSGVFDSANLVGPEGVVATYRKRNLVGTTLEHIVFTSGTEQQIVEAGGLRVSLAVCWDVGFPEMAREAALGGADLILVPADWRAPWGFQYDLSCAARPRQRRLRREREPVRRLPGSQLRNTRPRLRPGRNARLPLFRPREHRNRGPRNLPALASLLRQHARKGRRRRDPGDSLLKINSRKPRTPIGAVREPPPKTHRPSVRVLRIPLRLRTDAVSCPARPRGPPGRRRNPRPWR